MPKATIGAIVAGVETRGDAAREERPGPASSCIIATSTVTPVTIRMTPHGIALDRLLLVDRSRSRMSASAMTSAVMPTFMPKPATADDERGDPGRA